MEGDEALLVIGGLNYDFERSEKKSSKTRISDWDMDVQGPGFEHGFDHVLGSFLKTKLTKYHRFGSDPPPR